MGQENTQKIPAQERLLFSSPKRPDPHWIIIIIIIITWRYSPT
jgi:hypothetical protein